MIVGVPAETAPGERRVALVPDAAKTLVGGGSQVVVDYIARLRDRGEIREGARADVVVFDARKVADQATFDDPHRYPVGVEHVMVNGRFVIKDGEHTGSLPGRVLSPS